MHERLKAKAGSVKRPRAPRGRPGAVDPDASADYASSVCAPVPRRGRAGRGESLIEVVTLGGRRELAERAVQDLAKRLTGRLLGSGDEGYGEARRIWNRLIVCCAGDDDVRAAVGWAGIRLEF